MSSNYMPFSIGKSPYLLPGNRNRPLSVLSQTLLGKAVPAAEILIALSQEENARLKMNGLCVASQ